MKKQQTKILKAAIAHFGEERQLSKAVEESAELIQAILKYKEDNENHKLIDHLCEEIADVEVMLEQLKLITGMRSFIAWHKGEKILRLEQTIKKQQAAGLAANMPTIVEVKRILKAKKK